MGRTDAKQEYAYLIRNINNAALCICEWANNFGEADTNAINWGDVGTAGKILDDLQEICRFAQIELKEV